MRKINSYKDLLVWEKAHNMVLEIYSLTRHFPKEERYGLVQQIQRSAVSVPTNIAEGFSRGSIKEYIHFLYICRASLSETDYHLHLSLDLKYLSLKSYDKIKQLIDEIGKMVNGLINSLKTSSNPYYLIPST